MPTDVSGTINIIAEVVGQNQSPSNASDILEGRNKQETNKNRKGFLDIVTSTKTWAFIMYGLVQNASVASTTLQTFGRLIGIMVDVFLMPIMPLLTRGINVMGGILLFVQNVMAGNWSEIWAGLRDWWTKTWEEEGGLVGIIKELFLNATGLSLLLSLFAAVVMAPKAGLWLLKNSLGWASGKGVGLTKDLLKKLSGWTKTAAKTAISYIRTGARVAMNAVLSAPGLLKKLFVSKAPLFLKSALQSAWGVTKLFGKHLKNIAWKALLFGGRVITLTWSLIFPILTKIFSLLGGFSGLMTFGLVGLILAAVALITVGAIFVINLILNKVFNTNLQDFWDAMGHRIPFGGGGRRGGKGQSWEDFKETMTSIDIPKDWDEWTSALNSASRAGGPG